MALMRNKLLEALDQLRDNIKEEENLTTGKTPLVCTDAVLREIAKKKPLKISDFLAISGINRQFLDNYATKFLRVVMKHQTESVKEVTVSKSAYKVLDHYKDRLTNISRRNPNLYMGKTVKRSSFDLSLLNQDIDLIKFLTSKRVTTLRFEFTSTLSGENLERHITTLYRETNKEEKETGSYDLYIAYPYVEGVFKKDRFAIRAPLLYFPVKLTRNKREFCIKKDKDKDIIYNRDLLLATSKMEQSEIDSNVPFLNDFNITALKEIVIPFYNKNGIAINSKHINFDFMQYKPELKDTFVKRRTGVFTINETITLGRYKLYSSMIQKDMSKILDQNKYNELLEGLIDESNLYEDENNILNHNLIINSRNQTFTQYLLTTKDVNISVEVGSKDLKDTIINLKASWEDWKEFEESITVTKI